MRLPHVGMRVTHFNKSGRIIAVSTDKCLVRFDDGDQGWVFTEWVYTEELETEDGTGLSADRGEW